jgi:hypothetical protein
MSEKDGSTEMPCDKLRCLSTLRDNAMDFLEYAAVISELDMTVLLDGSTA